MQPRPLAPAWTQRSASHWIVASHWGTWVFAPWSTEHSALFRAPMRPGGRWSQPLSSFALPIAIARLSTRRRLKASAWSSSVAGVPWLRSTKSAMKRSMWRWCGQWFQALGHRGSSFASRPWRRQRPLNKIFVYLCVSWVLETISKQETVLLFIEIGRNSAKHLHCETVLPWNVSSHSLFFRGCLI
jgi:hypothetical protein